MATEYKEQIKPGVVSQIISYDNMSGKDRELFFSAYSYDPQKQMYILVNDSPIKQMANTKDLKMFTEG